MNTRQLRFPLSGAEAAVLTLPRTLPPDTLQQLEYALTSTLGEMRHALRNDATDPGQIEYASWSSPAVAH